LLKPPFVLGDDGLEPLQTIKPQRERWRRLAARKLNQMLERVLKGIEPCALQGLVHGCYSLFRHSGRREASNPESRGFGSLTAVAPWNDRLTWAQTSAFALDLARAVPECEFSREIRRFPAHKIIWSHPFALPKAEKH